MSGTATKLTPEARRRLQNLARFWNERIQAVRSDAALAQVCFDRARAAARQSQRDGNSRAMHELAEVLATWAQRHEDAHARGNTT
ncbi:hypothetical protein ACIBEJ_34200 [Nonomuraea sp. NPDC050790]|uniref:hypothetical protein n=1 Tax=Nonomuraea sp. NPDC050790 TaxID=3364371 RepID=UPI0037AC8808